PEISKKEPNLKRKGSKLAKTIGPEKKLKITSDKRIKKDQLRQVGKGQSAERDILQNEEQSKKNESNNNKIKYRQKMVNYEKLALQDINADSPNPIEDKERLERTLFVGNLPVSVIDKVGKKMTFRNKLYLIYQYRTHRRIIRFLKR